MCGIKRFKKIDEKYEYLETPYANPAEDYKKVFNFISEKKYNKNLNSISPPFLGKYVITYSSKKINMKRKNCVVIFNNSWGEVDFILPILKRFKKKGFKIYASFRSENLLKQKTKYQDLYKLLKIFSEIINPEKKRGK